MKNYMYNIIKDEFLVASIKNCDDRIKLLDTKQSEMYNDYNLSKNEINDIKILLLDKGKWIIETYILLENLAKDDKNKEFYHKRQLSNLINDFIRLKSMENNNNEVWTRDNLKTYLNDDKVNEEHLLQKINKHLKELACHSDNKVYDITSAITTNKEYGFKLSNYLREDSELNELYYIVNVIEHNNTRLNKIINKDEESGLYKYMFSILKGVFNQLIKSYNKNTNQSYF